MPVMSWSLWTILWLGFWPKSFLTFWLSIWVVSGIYLWVSYNSFSNMRCMFFVFIFSDLAFNQSLYVECILFIDGAGNREARAAAIAIADEHFPRIRERVGRLREFREVVWNSLQMSFRQLMHQLGVVVTFLPSPFNQWILEVFLEPNSFSKVLCIFYLYFYNK